jgi:GGDEF domain-containing protein
MTVALANDVTEKLRAERLLEYRAFHDPLTGLANRRKLEETAEALLRFDPARFASSSPTCKS